MPAGLLAGAAYHDKPLKKSQKMRISTAVQYI